MVNGDERTYSGDKVFAVLRHGNIVTLWVGEVHSLLLNELVHFRIILGSGVERRETDDHLVGQDTKSPPIDWEGVTTLNEDFRGEIVRSSTEGESLGVTLKYLGKAEICKADVTIFVHQDILGLQVTIYDIL